MDLAPKFEDDDGNDSPITSFEGNVKVEFLFSNINQPNQLL
jgi:hypothetical protein